MAITQNINTSQTAQCGYLVVEDTTTYGSASPDTRDDYGIAIFVSIDPGSGTFTDDSTLASLENNGAVGIPGTWDIDIVNATYNYEINAYWCPAWAYVYLAYDTGDIVYYPVTGTTGFWLKTAIGDGSGTPSAVSTEWTELTTSDFANFEAAESGYNISYEVNYVNVIACPIYSTIFKECDGVHRLIDNSDNSNSKRYSVTEYDGTEVFTEVEFSAAYVDITLPSDQVYILTIEEYIDSAWIEVAQLAIYEYCKIKSCFTYLIDSILCNEWDPCCDNCDESAIKKLNRQRLMVNQIVALYGTLLGYINEERMDYLGIVEMDADRLTYLERIENIFSKITAILNRCELCQGTWQTLSTSTTNSSGSYKPCNC